MVVLLCLPIISAPENLQVSTPRRAAVIDLPRLLAAGWTLRQIEERLDLMENCPGSHSNREVNR